MTDASEAISQALTALDAELCRHAEGRGAVSTLAQLQAFQRHLEAMRHRLESGDLPDPVRATQAWAASSPTHGRTTASSAR